MKIVAGLAHRKVNSLTKAAGMVLLVFAAVSVCAAQVFVNGGHAGSHAPHFSGPPFPTGAPPVPGYNNNYRYHYNYGPYYNNGSYGGRSRGGYAGWAYVMPYYYPVDDSAYGYDYVGGGAGPDLYSGPPLGPNDPMHMIGEQPPADPYGYPAPDAEAYAAPAPAAPPAPAAAPPEVKPGDPTVLVFRNGKQQEVTNYAIMGDTLYVFDQGRKKIALADLDLPATVKANDDRGMEFKLPPAAKKKPATTAPQSATPNQSTDAQPPNIAALTE